METAIKDACRRIDKDFLVWNILICDILDKNGVLFSDSMSKRAIALWVHSHWSCNRRPRVDSI